MELLSPRVYLIGLDWICSIVFDWKGSYTDPFLLFKSIQYQCQQGLKIPGAGCKASLPCAVLPLLLAAVDNNFSSISDAQRFETPAIDTNHYGNLSGSVDFVWTYTTPDLSKTSITCIVNLVNIVFKRASAGATAAIQPGYNGRATAIDDTTSSPYRIGFKLNNLAFSDASDYYCSMTYDSGPPGRSKVYRFKIYGKYCLIHIGILFIVFETEHCYHGRN